jgi:serine/threonine-protein kinase
VHAADIASFLVELFGKQTADVNEGVVPLEEGVGVTAQVAIPKGATQPIAGPGSTGPLTRTSAGQLERVTAPPPPQASPRAQLILALVVGGATALLVGFITLLAVWPRREPPPPDIPVVTGVGPNELVMPELELTPPPADAGAEAAVAPPKPPPRPPGVVKKPPRVVKKPPAAKPGKVTVRVNPWAEVVYAGKSYGVTPIPPIEVPSGTATFTPKNKQLKVTRKVSVKVPPGGAVVLKADLFKD